MIASIPEATKKILEQQINTEIKNLDSAVQEDIISAIKSVDNDPVLGLRVVHGILALGERHPEGLPGIITPEQVSMLINRSEADQPGDIKFNRAFHTVAHAITMKLEADPALRSGRQQEADKFTSLLLLGIANEIHYRQANDNTNLNDSEIADFIQMFVADTDRTQRLYRAGEIMFSQLPKEPIRPPTLPSVPVPELQEAYEQPEAPSINQSANKIVKRWRQLRRKPSK